MSQSGVSLVPHGTIPAENAKKGKNARENIAKETNETKNDFFII